MAGPIRISILANGTAAKAELSAVGRVATRTGEVMRKAGRVAALGLAAGIGAAVAVGKEFAESAAQDQAGAASLARQLKASADATKQQVSQTESYITAQGKLFGVTDDDLRPALEQLVVATHDVSKAQDLSSLAIDTAAAKHKDLSAVSTALSKAYLGQTGALGRLGIRTKDAAGKALTFTEITKDMATQFGGAASRNAKTLQGDINRLKVRFSEAGETLGGTLLPPLTELALKGIDWVNVAAKAARVNLAPKLQELSGWWADNRDEIEQLVAEAASHLLPLLKDTAKLLDHTAESVGGAAVPIAKDLLPALQELADILDGAVRFLDAIPDPLKHLGLEAAAAALLLPKLTSAVGSATSSFGLGIAKAKQFRAELTYDTTRTEILKNGFFRLGQVARQAAGIGGMLLLADGAKHAGSGMGTLEDAVGGAATGLAVGGPWGAAIGGAGGLLFGLTRSSHKAADAQDELAAANQRVIDTLNAETGAFTRRTKAQLVSDLGSQGLLKRASDLGLDLNKVTQATLSGSTALDRYRTSLIQSVPQSQRAELVDLFDELQKMSGALDSGQRGWLLEAKAMGKTKLSAAQTRQQVKDLAEQTSLLPKEARTVVQAVGAGASRAQIRQLLAQYHATPKQIRTVLNLLNVGRVQSQAKGTKAALEEVGKARPKTDAYLKALLGDTRSAERVASQGGVRVSRSLSQGTSKAKPNLQPWQAGLRQALNVSRTTASTGGAQVGNALQSGIIAGFAGTQAQLSAQAAAAVRAAVRAAKAAGKVQSPSKETYFVGQMLGQGLADGIASKEGEAARRAKGIVAAILSAVANGSEGVDKAIEKLTKLIDDHVHAKNQKDEAKRQKAILKAFSDQFEALKKNAKQQDVVNAKLEKAKDALKDLQQQASDYQASIVSTFASFADITQLGQNDNGTVTLTRLLSQLQTQAQKAQQYAADISQLVADHLNQTSLNQLISAGPSALATANAILSGGQAAIDTINQLVGQITGPGSAGDTLAAQLTQQFYGAGIKAAQGLVDGLQSQEKQLDKIARKLADDLVDAIKKKLGIKSPSKVFADLGHYSAAGLIEGLRASDVYVKRQGARTADSLTAGFRSRPALDYIAAGGATTSSSTLPVGRLHITSDGLHQLSRGREIRADLDAWDGVGGRSFQK